jgi:cytochrome c biogenesis protein CcmG, thiol:disulfide interchange protein DsbE
MALLSADTLRLMPGSGAPKRFAMRYIFATAALALGLPGAADAARRPPLAGADVLTGKHVTLSQFAGKPVFVSVWGSWCYGCRQEAPTLARFAKAHARQVAFLGIDTEDSKQGARRFCARYGLKYPSIWDPRGMLAGAWSRGAPTTLVFDRRHLFVKRIEGTASATQLNAALKQVTSTRR